ncbi:hypothetical protein J7E87_07530 [Streptomyces sp. ISL-1]|uniref:hypothetical protein n=1 Tax=Streptomyces sp. ISL-1 TaxID=2817657 RepID=UPI001BE75A1A|nr:hypothetical protein [Streptomyces sp. ISL-1]MBT2389279.1 hypothetical protein [Streptomyces sp. ISL-1]
MHIHQAPGELGLVELRAWITRIADEFEAPGRDGWRREARKARETRCQLDLLEDSLRDGQISAGPRRTDGHEGKDVLRRLLASGVARYLARSAPPVADAPLPEQVIVEVATVALWHVTLAPSLPDGWFDDLQYLTSPMLARSVLETRQAHGRRSGPSFEAFARAVAAKPSGIGLINLFDDLGDPKRGGPALTALALAGRVDPPPHRGGVKPIVAWILAGAIGTVAAGRADSLVRTLTSDAFDGLVVDIDIDLY